MTSPHPVNLAAALADLQTQLPVIKRTKKVRVTTDKGSYEYYYAPLDEISEAVLPIMGKLGLSFSAMPTVDDGGRFVLRYVLMHSSGESIGGDYPLKTGDAREISAAIKQMGSAITYARRYCLCAVVGVAAEDDDDAPDGAPQTTVQRRRRPAAQQPEPAEGQPVQRRAQTTAPPLPGEDAVEDPNAVTDPQKGKLSGMFRDLEVTDRDERLALMTDMLGRPIGSIKDLTKREASAAIDAIDKALKTDNPLTAMIEIYQRTQGTEPPPAGRPPGQRSRNAREAVTNNGDEGTEPAPWEGQLQ
jgi:hypothetical protein